jgi:hypothetical protein
MTCPGCAKARPFVPQALVMELLPPGTVLPASWKFCLDRTGFHVPDSVRTAILREKRHRDKLADKGGPLVGDESRRSPRPRQEGEPLEEEVRRSIIELLETLGYLVDDLEQGWRRPECAECGHPVRASTRVPLGLPDLHVVGHGVEWWAELKRPGGALTPDQRQWIATRRAAGAHVYVLRSAQAAWTLHEFRRFHDRLPTPEELLEAVAEEKAD